MSESKLFFVRLLFFCLHDNNMAVTTVTGPQSGRSIKSSDRQTTDCNYAVAQSVFAIPQLDYEYIGAALPCVVPNTKAELRSPPSPLICNFFRVAGRTNPFWAGRKPSWKMSSNDAAAAGSNHKVLTCCLLNLSKVPDAIFEFRSLFPNPHVCGIFVVLLKGSEKKFVDAQDRVFWMHCILSLMF